MNILTVIVYDNPQETYNTTWAELCKEMGAAKSSLL